MSYLYGASVQGIQSFIFQTNDLKAIVGASELVEQICTAVFSDFVGNGQIIQQAAGNVKCIFNNREECENAVREYPKKVMQEAPGITISQAVVLYEGDYSQSVLELEKRLRTQRNRPAQSLTSGYMAIERSQTTGLPLELHEGVGIDAPSSQKQKHVNTKDLCKKAFGMETLREQDIAYDIKDITKDNEWIAVVHADGNGLGRVVQSIGNNAESFCRFSQQLDEATKAAAVNAFNHVVRDQWEQGRAIPARPIVLGGDDFTVICRADFAVDYAADFIKEFEIQTQRCLGEILSQALGAEHNYLTACAGVAFIKSTYPFYYGYNLAESLCDYAKKQARKHDENMAPSCLMFHKVQDSFVQNYEDIVRRELSPQETVTFRYGPYYSGRDVPEGCPTVEWLNRQVNLLNSKEGNAVKSHLRQWMSLLHENIDTAQQKAFRILQIIPDGEMRQMVLANTCLAQGKSPVYDILSLYSVKFQVTK